MQPARTIEALGVGEIVDESFRLLRANMRLFVGIAAVTLVPAGLLFMGLDAANVALTPGSIGHTATPVLLASLLSGIVLLLLTLLSNAALAVAISQRYLDRHVTIGSAYTVAMSRFGVLVRGALIGLLYLVLLWLGAEGLLSLVARLASLGSRALGATLALGASIAVFGLFLRLVIGWVLVPQAVVLEHSGAAPAFRRSTALITGHRWKAAGVLLVSTLLLVVLAGIPAMLSAALLRALHVDALATTLIGDLLQLGFNVILSPIPMAATTLLFYDLKVRKEAFDLELLAGQLSHESPAWA